ncbi:SCO family protein [Paenibacillus hodogayensis]|uniref:SCO family protein n=1 Tax=Paenibacillus hodogayensis TaxID=279208 RepID=A0ABV5W2W1_9BACL
MKYRRRWMAAALLLACALGLVACGGGGKPSQLNYTVEPFRFTDQTGQPYALDDLKGKVWVADFIFTHCTTVCPTLTANMAKLQSELKQAGVQAQLVSFSVDPENDTPDALKTYIGKFTEDWSNWRGLTGYSFPEIQSFSRSSFKAAVQKDGESDQVIHGTSFYLIDQTGTVVSRYDGQETPYKQMVKDIRALSR